MIRRGSLAQLRNFDVQIPIRIRGPRSFGVIDVRSGTDAVEPTAQIVFVVGLNSSEIDLRFDNRIAFEADDAPLDRLVGHKLQGDLAA